MVVEHDSDDAVFRINVLQPEQSQALGAILSLQPTARAVDFQVLGQARPTFLQRQGQRLRGL
eukprot:15460080-Alexandrium_andersonii.AAC.1